MRMKKANPKAIAPEERWKLDRIHSIVFFSGKLPRIASLRWWSCPKKRMKDKRTFL